MKYKWDDDKNKTNYEKHGIWFEEAQTLWADQISVEVFDAKHSDLIEERFIKIGHSTKNRILLVVFCELDHGNIVRIISARKATSREIEDYEERI